MDENRAKEYISDTYKFNTKNVDDLFHNVECIGFVDSEKTFNNNTLLFNGNIFRGADTKKLMLL